MDSKKSLLYDTLNQAEVEFNESTRLLFFPTSFVMCSLWSNRLVAILFALVYGHLHASNSNFEYE